MTPRLAVTEEQAEDIASAFAMKRAWESVTLRLPERPTMPCPCGGEAHPAHALHSTSFVPIPEGTRVEVGWWGLDAGRPLADPDEWHHVAFATLTEVKPVEGYWPDDDYWLVVLSDITVEAP